MGPIQVDTVHEAITWLSVLVSQDKITHWHLVIRGHFFSWSIELERTY